MSLNMTSAALPPISQDFARPSLSDTRRPATSAGIIQLSGAALPGTNSLGGQGQHQSQSGMHAGQMQHNAFNALNAPAMMSMRMGGSAKGMNAASMSLEAARRSSLGLSAIDENAPTGLNHEQKAPMTTQGSGFRIPTGGGGGPPGSAGGMGPPGSAGGMSSHSNMLRRESDANYAGVFAHTVEDANISPENGRRDSIAFNNPFSNSVLDPALISGGSHSRPGSQQQQGVRFQSPADPSQNHMDYYSSANAWRRASEPHFKHAQNGYGSLPNSSALYPGSSMNGHPSNANNGLSMRDLQIATSQGRTEDVPATAPVWGSMQQPSPTSATSFASAPDPRSAYGGYNGYPPAAHMQQWQYGSLGGNGQTQPTQHQQQQQLQQAQAAQRRRSTQGATTGYYSTSSHNANEVSRRPSVVEGLQQGYGHEARHSMGVPPSGQWAGFPVDYRFGDVPPQHRSSGSGASSQMANGGIQTGHIPAGFTIGSYPDSSTGFVQPYDDGRNNSYSTASTQSRQSFARMSDSHISDPLRRNSTASSVDAPYSQDGSQDPASGPSVKKRPRRRFDQIERLYLCGYDGCDKSYGTLNHLNAHVSMQKHGQKRKPEGRSACAPDISGARVADTNLVTCDPTEFKDIRREWRKRKKEDARLAAEQAMRTGVMDPAAAEAMAWEAEGKWLAH